MSGTPVSTSSHPPHGHPDNTEPSTQPSDKPSTASHPPFSSPDPTTSSLAAGSPSEKPDSQQQNAQSTGSHPVASTPTSGTSQLSSLKTRLRASLRQYPDFPKQGILFEDFLPIFADHSLHSALIDALEMQVITAFDPATGGQGEARVLGRREKPVVDMVVGLEARGFLFGPALALRLGAGFVPVRKEGKMPGAVETASYKKEYGEDLFQMQKEGTIKEGMRVLVVDDLIATGGSAAAAGELVKKLGGTLVGYIFIIELDFLKGRDKLDAPVYALLSSQ